MSSGYKKNKFCVVIPTFNNALTLVDVIEGVRAYVSDVIIVDDGSTDATREVLLGWGERITVVSYSRNRGKMYALRCGFLQARSMGFTHVVTIDSDGQHYPEDIPKLLVASENEPECVVIGSRSDGMGGQPLRSSFANRFSNFWFGIQTGLWLSDTQSGFRIYPIRYLNDIGYVPSRYEGELALLVLLVWRGVGVVSVPVRVCYGENISHFRPFLDFCRISMVNTVLTLMAPFAGWSRIVWRCFKRGMSVILLLGLSVWVYSAGVSSVDPWKRLYAFPALKEKNTGMGVIVCPGGSYSWLAFKKEGVEVAKWLQSEGISAFVLRYRVATVSAYILGYRVLGLGHTYPAMLEDVEKALRYVYENRDLYDIDTAQIGVMGFSAGGHLSLLSMTHNRTVYRPHFVCAIYPVVTMRGAMAHRRSRRGALGVWGQFNRDLRDSLSIERHISDACPPVFIANCEDDKVVHPDNCILLDSALTTHNIVHTYLRYHSGGHGFGINSSQTTSEAITWKNHCLEWLKTLFL